MHQGAKWWIDSYRCKKWLILEPKCLKASNVCTKAHYTKERPNLANKKLSHGNNGPSTGNFGGITMYEKLYENGMRPDVSIFVAALKTCSIYRNLQVGTIIHADVIGSGYGTSIFVANTLVDMYAKCGSMVHACWVFDRMLHQDVVSWNAMIFGYIESGECELAFQLFVCMQEKGFIPDDRTYVAALKAIASYVTKEGKQLLDKSLKRECLQKGMTIHTQLAKSGYEVDIFVSNALIDMYAKCGSMFHAYEIFDKMCHHDMVSWNAIIHGYAENEEGGVALELFAKMQDKGFVPDARSYVAALKACASCAEKEVGKQIDGRFVKTESLENGIAICSQLAKKRHELNNFVAGTLVDMYAKCGSMLHSRWAFDRMEHPNMASWNALLFGYAESGESGLFLELYTYILAQGFMPDAQTYVAALKACGCVGALEIGKRIHLQICNAGFERHAVVATCLIGFYGKCGSMIDAQHVFDSTHVRGLVAWNTLLAGYAQQGDAKDVFNVFEKMQQECSQANYITFLSILTACSHAGLVDNGKEYFRIMCLHYKITPSLQHYVCIIDLLGRANQLDDAVAVLKNMPFEPSLTVWKTVLSACRKWMNVVVGRLAFESILQFSDEDASTYLLMENIYAGSGMLQALRP